MMRHCVGVFVICLVVVLCVPVGAADKTVSGDQALEVLRKMYCGTLDDGATRFGIFEGRAYSRIEGQKDIHLFNVLGVNTRQCGTVEDEDKGTGFRSVSREVMLYLDPESNQVIDSWENPLTGETVNVIHVANDPVNMHAPAFAVGRDGRPLEIELQQSGDMLVSRAEVPLFYNNPLGGEYQPYVGGHYHAMEIFNSFYDESELLTERTLSLSRVSWARIAQWLPWMEMGSRSGLMIVNATGFSTWEINQIPEPLMSVLKDRYPTYFMPPPLDDDRPNETSWTVFKKHLAAKGDE